MIRNEKTEAHYRIDMRAALLNLLVIMNPRDQINFGAMNYSELVPYALDFLQTENEEVQALAEQNPKPVLTADELHVVGRQEPPLPLEL